MNVVQHLPSFTFLPSARASRRMATRRDVVLPCQAVRERDFRLIAERTMDVSVDGLLLPVSEAMADGLMTGEALIVSFPIPGLWIDAEATVSRVIYGRRPGDDGPAVGIVFEDMSPTTRAALAGFLHGRPPPLPRRGPLARLRRGQDAPRLADQGVMESVMAPPALASELDVEDVLDDQVDEVDALGILREVADAWKRIVT